MESRRGMFLDIFDDCQNWMTKVQRSVSVLLGSQRGYDR